MKNIYNFKNLLIITIIYLASLSANGQDIYDKFSKKLCQCLEKEKVTTVEAMPRCFEEVLIKNIDELKEYYGVTSFREINTEELGNKVAAKLLKNCDYALEAFSNQQKQEDKIVTKQPNLTCEDLKSGDFYYLNGRSNTTIPDTTYVTISNNMFLERMNNGRTYSLLNLEWKGECKFKLIFKESNDPFKKELSKPGDTYLYEVMTNGPESIVVKVYWRKEEFQVELFKVK